MDSSAGDSGQMFLFDPRVVTYAFNAKSEQVAVEPQTRVGIANGDGAMVYAEEQLVRRGMPLRLPFVGREVDQLQCVAVGISEVEGFDAGGIDIPIGRRCGPDEICSTCASRSRSYARRTSLTT